MLKYRWFSGNYQVTCEVPVERITTSPMFCWVILPTCSSTAGRSPRRALFEAISRSFVSFQEEVGRNVQAVVEQAQVDTEVGLRSLPFEVLLANRLGESTVMMPLSCSCILPWVNRGQMSIESSWRCGRHHDTPILHAV